MSEVFYAACGVASGVLMAGSGLPYLRDIFRHTTKPARATWWVWAGLAVMALVAQIQAGSTWSLIMTAASALSCGAIAILSVKYGYGKFKARDISALVIAALGMGLSYVLKSPLVALLIIIGVDMIGYILTLIKTWEAPETETLSTWIIATAGSLFGFLAVSHPDFTKLVYPAYIVVGNSILIAVIISRRKILSR